MIRPASIRVPRHFLPTMLCVTAALFPTACTTFAPVPRTARPVALSESFVLYQGGTALPSRWWESFESEELDGLVVAALAGNFTLEQAAARLRVAAAEARQSRAALRPTVDASAGASVTRSQRDNPATRSQLDMAEQRLGGLASLLAPGSGGVLQDSQSRLRALNDLLEGAPASDLTSNTQSYVSGLSASYEVDLWGRIRADFTAAQLDAEASNEDLRSAMETIAAQVVLTWLDLIEAQKELDLIQSQIEANRTTLDLVELRRSKQFASALDVYQQRVALARTEAIVPTLELQIESLHYQLALLLGLTPEAGPRVASTEFPELGPLPDAGVPAELLARRPDVRAAGLRLHAADWAVAAARADRLPSLRLSAGLDLSGNSLDDVFDDWLARLAASVTGPIFDGGRRKAAVERARAVVDERLAGYKAAVVTAVHDVSQALLRETKQRELLAALGVQYRAAKATHDEALARYLKGLNDYLPVLNALTNMQNLEQTLVREERALAFERVQLALALGGDWMDPALLESEESR